MSTQVTPPRFVNRDYESALSEMLSFIKETRQDVFSDFTESSLGVLLTQLAAAVIDNVSFGQDAAALEVLLATCKRYESGLLAAESVGYVPRPMTAATATMVSSDNAPTPLVTYGGTIRAGQAITGANGLRYEVVDDTLVSPGVSILRVNVREGASYREQFNPVHTRNLTVQTARGNVANGSWSVFVGDETNPDNEWKQVDSIYVETSASKTYEVRFDAQGRAIFRFGNNAAGKIPDDIITVRYRDCHGTSGNCPARSIKGTLLVDVAAPGTGTHSVEFQNYEVSTPALGGTQVQSGEVVATTGGLPSLSFVLSNAPVVSGQVQITITSTLGAITLKDDNAGGFTITGNSTPLSLVSSTIIYSGGSVALTFSGNVPTGGQAIADYQFFVQADPSQVVITGAATGGDDRETLEELRINIPVFIRTQDRLITSDDYSKGVRRVAGVDLAFTDVWNGSYNGNVIRMFVWSSEDSSLTGFSSDGTSITVPYRRYARASDAIVLAVQDFIKPRTLLTTHHIIERPEIAWVDVYLGNVKYDRRLARQTVRENILAAIAATFESFDGFSVILADLYNAVHDVQGVLQFNIERIVVGHRDTSSVAETQGATTATNSISGTLTRPYITPGSVQITVSQGAGIDVILKDDGIGGFIPVSGVDSVVGSINYITGEWTATIPSTFISGRDVIAVYRDVQKDYRRAQMAAYNDPVSPDAWPPPLGVYGPDWTDGRPKNWDPAAPLGTSQYEAIRDINLSPLATSAHYYDGTYLYNSEILYNSVDKSAESIRAINARRVQFDMVPA